MSAASTFTIIIRSFPHLARMSLSLFYLYLSLGRRVRKARLAFERELIMKGMSKEDARRLSFCFEELKNSLKDTLKLGLTRSFLK